MPKLNIQTLIANPATMDEETWNAIEVAQVALEGWIWGIFVVNETTGEEFIYSEKSDRNPFPIEIPYDHVVYIYANGENTGTIAQDMTFTVELIDPDGIVRASKYSNHYGVSPGTLFGSGFTPSVSLDKSGMWIIHAILEAELT
jgi:hypothetical protein